MEHAYLKFLQTPGSIVPVAVDDLTYTYIYMQLIQVDLWLNTCNHFQPAKFR